MNRSTLIVVLLFSGSADSLAGSEPPPPATAEQVRNAIWRGIDSLLQDQNPDGWWGGHYLQYCTRTGEWVGIFRSTPERHPARRAV